jgi:hypothetical protein
MKNILSIILVAAFFITPVLGLGVSSIQAEEETDRPKEVKLKEHQQQELAILYQDLINKKKGIINLYVEFGVISEDKGQDMKAHLDEYYKKLEGNKFMPYWHKQQHHKKHPE